MADQGPSGPSERESQGPSGLAPEDPLGPEPDGSEADESAPAPHIDAALYRQVLGHFPTGVAVVTASDRDEPAGLAVNSFASVSLEPPLVAFCVTHSSATWGRIQAAGAFCVNILSDDQEYLSRVFATRVPHKFRGVGWRPAPSGAPIISDVLAWIDCTVDAVYPAGDHSIVVGRVGDLDTVREGRPLVFYRGGYGRFEP